MCSWNIRLPQFVSSFPVETVWRLQAYNYDVLFVPVNSLRKWRSCTFQHSVVTLGRQYDQFQPSCDVTTYTIYSYTPELRAGS